MAKLSNLNAEQTSDFGDGDVDRRNEEIQRKMESVQV
jgi:hypothetical protein